MRSQSAHSNPPPYPVDAMKESGCGPAHEARSAGSNVYIMRQSCRSRGLRGRQHFGSAPYCGGTPSPTGRSAVANQALWFARGRSWKWNWEAGVESITTDKCGVLPPIASAALLGKPVMLLSTSILLVSSGHGVDPRATEGPSHAVESRGAGAAESEACGHSAAERCGSDPRNGRTLTARAQALAITGANRIRGDVSDSVTSAQLAGLHGTYRSCGGTGSNGA